MNARVLILALFLAGIALAILLTPSKAPAPPPEAAATANPQRILSAAPSMTETLFAIGAGERVVGVSDFCTYPPAATGLPRIGGLYNPDLEAIARLRPDLVLLAGKQEKVESLCAERSIRCRALPMDTLDEIKSAIRTVGEETGRTRETMALLRQMQEKLDTVAKRVAGRPRRRVFFCLGHSAGELIRLCTPGQGRFLSELMEIAGGENIFSDAPGAWPVISKEALVRRAPEVLLETVPGQPQAETLARLRADWEALDTLPAVREGRVVMLTEEYIQIPGPRVAETAERLARAIHPEAFDE